MFGGNINPPLERPFYIDLNCACCISGDEIRAVKMRAVQYCQIYFIGTIREFRAAIIREID